MVVLVLLVLGPLLRRSLVVLLLLGLCSLALAGSILRSCPPRRRWFAHVGRGSRACFWIIFSVVLEMLSSFGKAKVGGYLLACL